jgi:hypothetical protein
VSIEWSHVGHCLSYTSTREHTIFRPPDPWITHHADLDQGHRPSPQGGLPTCQKGDTPLACLVTLWSPLMISFGRESRYSADLQVSLAQ